MPLHFMYATRGNRKIGRTNFAKGISRASLAWLHVILLPLFLPFTGSLCSLCSWRNSLGAAPNIISLAFIQNRIIYSTNLVKDVIPSTR